MTGTVFTVGHSTHTLERFIALLQKHGITAIGDVRSKPYSRLNPQFNREELKAALRAQDIAYVFLGRELGARSKDVTCYRNGKVQYDRLAETALFQHGMNRVKDGAGKYSIALMCAEKEPLDCHRTILVARHTVCMGLHVKHILGNGQLEEHAEAFGRLVRQLHLPTGDMFSRQDEVFEEAYRLQGERIAFSPLEPVPTTESRSVRR